MKTLDSATKLDEYERIWKQIQKIEDEAEAFWTEMRRKYSEEMTRIFHGLKEQLS
jgi:hypothetical protein